MSGAKNSPFIEHIASLAREKGVPETSISHLISQSLKEIISRSKNNIPVDVNVDIESGNVKIFRILRVVSSVENADHEISMDEAIEFDDTIKVGDCVRELIPDSDAVLSKLSWSDVSKIQVLIKKGLQNIEKEKEFNAFKDKIGSVVSGFVKQNDLGNLIIDLGTGEGFLSRNELIPGETYSLGSHVKAYISNVTTNLHGSQIQLSRRHDGFLIELFSEMIPEVADELITIHAVARDPGSRAIVAVSSSRPTLNAIGACLGRSGKRVDAISESLSGEKISVIKWSEDLVQFVVNALHPIDIKKVIMHDQNDLEIVVPETSLGQLYGHKCQKLRLVKKLTGCIVRVISENEELYRRENEKKESVLIFKHALGISELQALSLVESDIVSLDIFLQMSVEEINTILASQSSDISIEQLQEKAQKSLLEREKCLEMESDPLMIHLPHMSLEKVQKLKEINVQNINELVKIDKTTLNEAVNLTHDEIDQLMKVANEFATQFTGGSQ